MEGHVDFPEKKLAEDAYWARKERERRSDWAGRLVEKIEPMIKEAIRASEPTMPQRDVVRKAHQEAEQRVEEYLARQENSD